MARTVMARVVLLGSLVAIMAGAVAGPSAQTQTRPIPKKPAKTAPPKTEPKAKPDSAPASDIKIRTRYTVGAQVSENTTYLKGTRQRVEFPGVVSIEQCDLGRTLLLSPAAKSYLVKSRAATASPSSAGKASASGPDTQPKTAPGASAAAKPPKGGVVTYVTTLTDTGERKQLFNHEARRITTTIARQADASACNKSAETVEIDGWYIDVAGVDRCPIAPASPTAGEPKTDACVDRMETETRGEAKLGFPVAVTTTTRTGEGDKQETMTSSMEVTDFEVTTLDAALFDVPAGYTEVRSSAEFLSGAQSGGGLADALVGSTADGTSSAAPKSGGAIRIGVLEPVDKSTHSLPTRELRQELTGDFHKAPFEALTLAGQSPAAAQADAARMQCDYVLYTEVTDIRTSKPGRVGGMLKKVSRDGPPKDVHEVKLDYKLYPVGAGAPVVAETTKANSGGGFDLHSALHVAMFAGSLYLRFTGLGLLSPTLMGTFGGVGPLGGSGLFDPRMSAMSTVAQLAISTAASGDAEAADSGSPTATGTSGTADDSEAVIRQTVGSALANAAKGTMEQLQKNNKTKG